MDIGLGSKTIGTYVKVLQLGLGDAYLVLYLLDSGVYLFIGYWHGQELTVAAGRWNESKNHVRLDGVGAILYIDVIPYEKEPCKHEREFNVEIEHASRALFTDTEHKDWSLLSWPGRFNYIGKFHLFDLKDNRLPGSFDEVEIWAQRFMDRCGFQSK